MKRINATHQKGHRFMPGPGDASSTAFLRRRDLKQPQGGSMYSNSIYFGLKVLPVLTGTLGPKYIILGYIGF